MRAARTSTNREVLLLAATVGMRTAQLEVETVAKASQALSTEIVLSKLIEKSMRTAGEHAGAERCLLWYKARSVTPACDSTRTHSNSNFQLWQIIPIGVSRFTKP
jgi:hypothetical protein